ncbi:MAG: DNA alkylation repair protein [Lachnospiraceae bacterium]|nr:DNA alkylation repair protein [Lachnospiraceae bacterium]
MDFTVENVKSKLFELQDLEYKAFHSRLMPTISPETIIGVRTPALRKFAKEIAKYDVVEDFIADLPHAFYEENNLHGFLVEGMKDYDKCLAEVDRFLPYVDNWATCDMMRPKVFKKNPEGLLPKIKEWMASGKTYMVRYGIGMLMTYFLDEHFEVKYVDEVAAVESEEYYVKMMVAWYFATALAKQWDAVIPYIESGKLEKWTHNKAIQKAIESYRIKPEQKEYLRGLKRR